MQEDIISKLVKISEKSLKHDDVPVAAIVTKNGKIVSKSYNNREKSHKTIAHAEINAILKANKKLKNKYLYECDMYVTLKPCEMCEKIINQSRIRNVYYILDKPSFKKEFNKTDIRKIDTIEEEKYRKLLQDFFNKIRKK